jgi:hypothetical protein
LNIHFFNKWLCAPTDAEAGDIPISKKKNWWSLPSDFTEQNEGRPIWRCTLPTIIRNYYKHRLKAISLGLKVSPMRRRKTDGIHMSCATAYDKVNWLFLQKILCVKGFAHLWCEWIARFCKEVVLVSNTMMTSQCRESRWWEYWSVGWPLASGGG